MTRLAAKGVRLPANPGAVSSELEVDAGRSGLAYAHALDLRQRPTHIKMMLTWEISRPCPAQ